MDTHGPVVKKLYHEYKNNGSGIINPPDSISLKKYGEKVGDLLEEIWSAYGQYSASKLRNLTHEDKPWVEAFEKGPGTVISKKSMKEYFKTQLV